MGDNSLFLIIDNFAIYWNGVTIMIAVLAGMLLAAGLRVMQKRDMNNLLIASIASAAGAFIGARIFFYWNASEYFSDFWDIFNFTNGGYAVFGGIIGALVATIIVARVRKESIGELLDVMAPGLALAVSIGRWGALFTGENLGQPVEKLQKLPFAVYSESEGTWLSALFFYQSVIALIICAALVCLFRAKYSKHSLRCKTGDIYLMFLFLYSLPQGIFEMHRIDALFFHSLIILRLKSVPVSLAFSAICSAVTLSIFILRRVFRSGVSISTAWPVLACAVGYFSYFNVTLRVNLPSEELEQALVIVGGIILLITGIVLFILLHKEDVLPVSPRAPKNPLSRKNTQPQQNSRPQQQRNPQRPQAPQRPQGQHRPQSPQRPQPQRNNPPRRQQW